jgi:hypothetical protein
VGAHSRFYGKGFSNQPGAAEWPGQAPVKEYAMSDRKYDKTNKEAHPGAKGAAGGAVTGGVVGGVAGGATTGALAGGLTGPAGAAIGAVVGAVVGAVAGRRAKVDHTAEDSYWRDNYASRPYVQSGRTYDDYAPAYRHGAQAYEKYPDRHFDEVEPDLQRDWGTARGKSSLEWDHARHASRDAWTRLSDSVERAVPGDSDRDGR